MATTDPMHPSSRGVFRHYHGAQVFFSAWCKAVILAASIQERRASGGIHTAAERHRALLVASGVWGEVVGQWTIDYANDLVSDAAFHKNRKEGA